MANNRGLWQGAERATANLANTGMRLLEYQSRREDRAETLDLTKRGLELRQKQFASDEERNRLLNRKTQMDIAAQEKKEELTTFEEIFQKMGVTDKRVQDYILKYAGPYVETGPVSGKPSIQKQYGREFYNKLNADDNAVLGIVTLRGRGIKEEIASIDEQLGARIMMPRKKEELLKQKVSLEAQLAAADNVAKKLMGRKDKKPISLPSTSRLVSEEGEVIVEAEDKKPTYSKIEGEAFAAWMEDPKKLTAQQKQIVDKKLKESGVSVEKAALLVKARMKAKIESYTEQLGRPPTKQELRALYINDPWGFLGDEDGGEKLEGMEPGIYKVDGVEVKWDGTKRIE